jgi:hypothetical protein
MNAVNTKSTVKYDTEGSSTAGVMNLRPVNVFCAARAHFYNVITPQFLKKLFAIFLPGSSPAEKHIEIVFREVTSVCYTNLYYFCTAEHPRRQLSSYSPPWEPEISPND